MRKRVGRHPEQAINQDFLWHRARLTFVPEYLDSKKGSHHHHDIPMIRAPIPAAYLAALSWCKTQLQLNCG